MVKPSGTDRRVHSLFPRSAIVQENRQEIYPVSESKWIPHHLSPKDSDWSRHVFLNVRGISSWDCHFAFSKFKKWDSSFLHLSDTKLEEGHTRSLEYSLKQTWSSRTDNSRSLNPRWIHSFGTQGVKTCVGGTSTAVHGAWTTRMGERITDFRNWGRWAGCLIIGKSGHRLVVLSVYGPTFTANSEGSSWSYQLKKLEEMRSKGHNVEATPAAQFLVDLSTLITEWHGQGAHVVLGGDFNKTASALNEWASTFLLKNVSHLSLGNAATYVSGHRSSAIDHIFVSKNLWNRGIVKNVFLYTEESGNTDHFPLVLDLDLIRYLNITSSDLPNSVRRAPVRFTCQSDPMVKKFTEECSYRYKQLNLHHSTSLTKYQVTCQLSQLTHLIVASAKVASSVIPTCRDYFDGWSPEAITLATHARKFSKIINRWKRNWSSLSILKYAISLKHSLDFDKFNVPLPQSSDTEIMEKWIDALQNKVTILRKKLQGRYRTEMRKKMGYRVRQREELREKLKLKDYFNKIFDRSLSGPLESITIGSDSAIQDEKVISNPKELGSTLLSHMEKWFGKDRSGWYLEGSAKTLWSREEGYQLRMDIADGRLDQAKEICPKRFHHILHSLQRKKKANGERISEKDYKGCNDPISRNEWISYWQHKRRGTAPGPSTLSVDMMKALPADILEHLRLLINDIWMNGWIYEEWTKNIMLLIPKSHEQNDIERIRPLRLLEILRKSVFGILRSRILAVWTKTNILSEHQYAFLPGKGTVQPLINLTLVIQHSLLTHSDLHIVSQDIRRAFDSVESTLGKEMPLRRLGVPEKFINFLLDYDEYDQTDILTGYGKTSELLGTDEGYFHAERGWGQGTEEGPAGWVAFQDVMLSIMECSDTPGYRFNDQRGSFKDMFGQSFADDSLWFATSAEGAANRCTLANDFLEFMGGSLAIPKCVYSSLRWKSKYTGPTNELSFLSLNSDQDKFETSTTKGDETIEMKSVPPSVSFKYLGILFNLKGRWHHQLSAIQSRLHSQVASIYNKNISANGAWIVCQTIFKPQVLYSTLVVGNQDNKIDEIERIAKRFFFKHAKLPITFPTDLLGAHESRMGVGWIPWKDETHLSQCVTLMQLLNEDSPTGILTRLALSLLDSYCDSSFRGDCNLWLRYPLLWMSKFGLSLGIKSEDKSRKGYRENDKKLLDICHSSTTSTSDLKEIRKWCYSLELVWLSDIVDEDGISPSKWLTQREGLASELIGKSLICELLFSNGRLLPSNRLGKWIRKPALRPELYSVILTPYGLCQVLKIEKEKITCAILHLTHSSERLLRQSSFSSFCYSTSSSICTLNLQQTCSIRAYPFNQRRGFRTKSSKNPSQCFRIYENPHSLRSRQIFLVQTTCSPLSVQPLDLGEHHDSQYNLTHWISQHDHENHTFHVYTDGSVLVRENRSTYSWLLGDIQHNTTIKVIYQVYGRTPHPIGSELTSFRAEAMALFSALYHLADKIHIGNLIIHTDSESCLKVWSKLMHMSLGGLLRQEDKDIWKLLRDQKERWGSRATVKWVKSHMDILAPQKMDVDHIGNVLADKGATTAYRMYSQITEPNLPYPFHYSLLFNGKIVTADYLKFLKEVVKLHYAKKYISRLEAKYTITLWSETNWLAFESLAKKWTVGSRIKSIKLLWGFVASASILSRRGCEEVDGTPACKLCDLNMVESSWHIFAECTHPDIIEIRKKLPTIISSLLLNAGVDSDVSQLLSSSWHLHDAGVFKALTSEEFERLLIELGNEGQWTDSLIEHLRKSSHLNIWNMKGFLSQAWTDTLQHAGLSARKAQALTSSIIGSILDTINRCWQVRNDSYHQKVKAITKGKKLEIERRLREIILGPEYDDRPDTRTNLLEISQRYSLRNKKRLLQNLESKKPTAQIEAVHMYQPFSILTPSSSSIYKEKRFSLPFKSSYRIRIECPPSPPNSTSKNGDTINSTSSSNSTSHPSPNILSSSDSESHSTDGYFQHSPSSLSVSTNSITPNSTPKRRFIQIRQKKPSDSETLKPKRAKIISVNLKRSSSSLSTTPNSTKRAREKNSHSKENTPSTLDGNSTTIPRTGVG